MLYVIKLIMKYYYMLLVKDLMISLVMGTSSVCS